MARVTNRQEFAEFCLRRLGYPVVNIEASEEQIDERIDDALGFYYEHHYEALDEIYYKHQLTATDIQNKYIIVPESLLRVMKAFPVKYYPDVNLNTGIERYFSTPNTFLINRTVDNLLTTSTDQTGYVPQYSEAVDYLQSRYDLETFETLSKQEIPIRFNRHLRKVYLDWQANSVKVNDYIILEAKQIIDPEINPSVYNDWWLKKYATALIKKQWAENLIKFSNIQLPGGAQFDATNIFQSAVEEINTLEQEAQEKIEIPFGFIIG